MSVDRNRIAKLVQNSKRIDVVTLNPHESDQQRQSALRKLTDNAMRTSNQQSILVAVLAT